MEASHVNQLLVLFTLVLARLGGLMAVAPVLGSRHVPVRFRALLAVFMALIVTPLQSINRVPAPGLLDYAALLGGEALVGLTLGMGVAVLFAGIRVTGQLVSQMGGLQLADVFSPGSDESVPVVSELLYLVALAVFLTSGGHRKLVEAVLDTFQSLPLGIGISASSLAGAATTVVAESFALGVRAAAPIVASLLLATLVAGLLSRILPQFNTAIAGFGLNAAVLLGSLGVTLGAAAWVFNSQVEPVLELLLDALRS